MRRTCVFLAGLLACAVCSATAWAHQIEFISPHPVPHKFGGGFCNIDVPHTHNYVPEDRRLYRETNGQYYFVGDPAPFGYDGPRYSYYGAHPVVDAQLQFTTPVFCYIKGPHFHWYQPPPQAQFQLTGGAYWYVGAFPRAYYNERPHYAAINEAYAPMPYVRPVVDVAVAPPVVAAEISLGGPGWGVHAMVGAPVVPVAPVAPVVVAPAPAPGPAVQIGVGINLGGPPVVVGPGPGGVYEERYHHDHGRHVGWGPHVERHHGRPDRFIAGPAPVRQPVLGRGRGPAPGPHFGPRVQPAHRDDRGRHR